MSEIKIMLGNEAIARGAYEAGVKVSAAYPGTPSTEISENIVKYPEIYAEWSPNEKVAMEVAIGASISGGENLYPVQIEDFIRTNDKVHDVAVIGLKHKRLGEIPAAVIEVKEGMEMTEEEVNAYCMALPRYKRPHVIIFAEIPRNPTGKIEKPRLREMYGAAGLVADQNMG